MAWQADCRSWLVLHQFYSWWTNQGASSPRDSQGAEHTASPAKWPWPPFKPCSFPLCFHANSGDKSPAASLPLRERAREACVVSTRKVKQQWWREAGFDTSVDWTVQAEQEVWMLGLIHCSITWEMRGKHTGLQDMQTIHQQAQWICSDHTTPLFSWGCVGNTPTAHSPCRPPARYLSNTVEQFSYHLLSTDLLVPARLWVKMKEFQISSLLQYGEHDTASWHVGKFQ